jgi:hypothetical protein
LCGYQTLIVRDASKLVAAINGKISEALIAENPPESVDKASREMMLKAAHDKHAWLKLEPGRVSATVPMSWDMAKRSRQNALGVEGLAEILKGLEPPAPSAPSRQQVEQLKLAASFWADNPWSFDQRRDRVVVSLGVGDGEPIRLDCPPTNPREPTTFDAALADYAKTLPVKFRKDVITVEAIIEEFAKQHAGAKRSEK